MEPVIHIEQLRKNYGSKQVLHGVNLKVYPGAGAGIYWSEWRR
jgi:ABC-type transporter Mla maintaining outer membrane lipid asymmetry ATPase subunit MlaF